VGRLLQEHGTSWVGAFGLNRGAVRGLVWGGLAALAALPLLWGLQWISVTLLSLAGWTPRVQAPVDLFAGTGLWSERLILAGITLVLAPLCEEVLFRGVLYSALKQTGWPVFAFWTTAVVFALVHFHVETFLPLLLLACLLNVLYDRTGNLLACIAAHSVFNAVNLGMIVVLQHWFPHLLET
jgi:membrane protease YdiL (CAAX protease family)